ncbi:hypothetical protein [Flavobacterium sp.]|jgi:hypothetical protein|uniref:hypothetical protein n=1 Tax=Flavobacterium sp. TaxID=239 RepID=UPI0037C19D4D
MNIKLNPAKPVTPEVEQVKVAPEAKAVGPEPTPELPLPEPTEGVTFVAADRVPSDWVLSAVGSLIEGRNNRTGKRFVGSREQFNALLKG